METGRNAVDFNRSKRNWRDGFHFGGKQYCKQPSWVLESVESKNITVPRDSCFYNYQLIIRT